MIGEEYKHTITQTLYTQIDKQSKLNTISVMTAISHGIQYITTFNGFIECTYLHCIKFIGTTCVTIPVAEEEYALGLRSSEIYFCRF